MKLSRPLLVLASGAPATGKSTLAVLLAREHALPLLSKDTIKETLGDSLGAADREASQALGRAAYDVLDTMVAALLDASVGAVVGCNFHRGMSEAGLRPHVAHSRAVLLHCATSPEETLRRYAARTAAGDRHPVHHDDTAIAELRANLVVGRFAPLDLDVPTLLVDTTDGYAPDLPAIVAFVRSHAASGDAGR